MIILVTGGQRSGKSTFAESLLRDKENVSYIATSLVEDKEMEDRVKAHRMSRPSYWHTIEAYRDFVPKLNKDDYYLFECVGTMTSNIMFERTKDLDFISPELSKEIEDEIFSNLYSLIEKVREDEKTIVFVTNEVGFSLTSPNHLGRVYTDILGRINQKLGREADQVYLVVCGIEMRIK